jgi:hypothetical protein
MSIVFVFSVQSCMFVTSRGYPALTHCFMYNLLNTLLSSMMSQPFFEHKETTRLLDHVNPYVLNLVTFIPLSTITQAELKAMKMHRSF